jgi:CRP-like cAMP-binding protein
MANPVIKKLVKYNCLSTEAIADIEHMLHRKSKVKRGIDILAGEGSADAAIAVILDGWACRYILLPSGDRQIIGLMAAGDFSDTRAIRLAVSSFGIMAMTDATIAWISPPRFNAVLDRNRDVVVAFAKAQLAEESIMQTWIANMARKSAREAMAHLLCEIVSRVSRSNEDLDMVIKLPFAQSDLADLLGLSPVHVNRVLQSLRADGLIHLRSKWLEVCDYPGLAAVAEFDPSYLYYGEAKAA